MLISAPRSLPSTACDVGSSIDRFCASIRLGPDSPGRLRRSAALPARLRLGGDERRHAEALRQSRPVDVAERHAGRLVAGGACCLISIRLSERVAEHDHDDPESLANGGQQFARAHEQAAVAGQRDHRPFAIERAPRRSPPAARTPSSTIRSRSASDSARCTGHSIVAGNMCAPASTVTRRVARQRARRRCLTTCCDVMRPAASPMSIALTLIARRSCERLRGPSRKAAAARRFRVSAVATLGRRAARRTAHGGRRQRHAPGVDDRLRVRPRSRQQLDRIEADPDESDRSRRRAAARSTRW